MLKRYVAFVFERYEAGGGWNDVLSEGTDEAGKLLVLSWDTVEEAAVAVQAELARDHSQIVDLHTGQIVRQE